MTYAVTLTLDALDCAMGWRLLILDCSHTGLIQEFRSLGSAGVALGLFIE